MPKKKTDTTSSLSVIFFSSIVISCISMMFLGSVISNTRSIIVGVILALIVCSLNVYLYFSGYRSAKARGSIWWKRIFVFTMLAIIIYTVFMSWFVTSIDLNFTPTDEHTSDEYLDEE